jgi:hypothetical protein
MIGLTRRAILKPPVPPRTYAEFVTRTNALGANGAYSWGNGLYAGSDLIFRTTAATPTGDMAGSPWLGSFGARANGNSSTIARIVQHSFPTEQDLIDVLASSERQLLVQTVAAGTGNVSSIGRFGYTSEAATGVETAQVKRLLYYLRGQAWEVDPSTGAGPTPYTW